MNQELIQQFLNFDNLYFVIKLKHDIHLSSRVFRIRI